jgi:hypothetical protein
MGATHGNRLYPRGSSTPEGSKKRLRGTPVHGLPPMATHGDSPFRGKMEGAPISMKIRDLTYEMHYLGPRPWP